MNESCSLGLCGFISVAYNRQPASNISGVPLGVAHYQEGAKSRERPFLRRIIVQYRFSLLTGRMADKV